MSYARFSTDNFRSDVYVYLSARGWVIHVAANKVVLPDGVEVPDVTAQTLDGTEEAAQKVTALWAGRTEILQNATHEPIGGGYDGQEFVLSTADECLAILRKLGAKGYYVPQSALDKLEEEVANE